MDIFSDVNCDWDLMATSSSGRPFSADRLLPWSDPSKEGSGVASGAEPIIWFATEGVVGGRSAAVPGFNRLSRSFDLCSRSLVIRGGGGGNNGMLVPALEATFYGVL